MDGMRRRNQKVYGKLRDFDEELAGDELLPSRGAGRGSRGGRASRAPAPKFSLQDIKEQNPKLYKELVDDLLQEYDSVDEIPDQVPVDHISSPDLRRKVADCMKAIESNKALDSIAPNRLNAMLKSIGKKQPADGEEMITPEDALELIEKAKKKLIDLKGDELRALKKIAMNDPNYEFEEVSLTPDENRKLDKALNAADIDLEELKRDFPELYKELKRDIADVIAATGKVPKSIKASALSPELALKLAESGLVNLTPEAEELLEQKAEEEMQQAHHKQQKLQDQLDGAVDALERQQTEMDGMRRRNQKVYGKLRDFDEELAGDELFGMKIPSPPPYLPF
jgi:predicted Rdx family selenoprotein